MRTVMLAALLAVLAPFSAAQTVLSTIAANPDLSIFSSLLQTSGMATAISGNGPYSVFAPTNEAFAFLPPYVVAYYNASLNAAIMDALLAYHIVPHKLVVANFIPDQEFLSGEGDPIYVEYVHGTTDLGLASITCQKSVRFVGTQTIVGNGGVQAIDTVMFPQSLACPNKLFWAESTGIQRIGNMGYDCRSSGFDVYGNNSSPGASIKNPAGVAVATNIQQQLMFWSNSASSSASFLSSVGFDGSQMLPLYLVGELPTLGGLDVQHTINASNLFIASPGANTVFVSAYDGSLMYQFWNGSAGQSPIDVAVDTNVNFVFIAVVSGASAFVGNVSIHGGAMNAVTPNLPGLTGICLDRFARHLFAVQSSGTISCYAYGNVSCPLPTISGLPGPYSCDVDNIYVPYGGPSRVVFTSPSTGSIMYVDTSNGALVTVANNLNGPISAKLGCLPRPSTLLPLEKIATQLFSDAVQASVTAVIEAVLPGAAFKMYPITTTQEEPEVLCPSLLSNYSGYIVEQAKTWSYAVAAATKGAITATDGGSGLYAGITSTGPSFLDTASIVRSANATISAGGGVGYGLSVQCNDTVLFSFGLGVGGGYSSTGMGFSGGGSGIIGEGTPTVSGGGQCDCTGPSCSDCSGGAAAGSAGDLPSLSASLLALTEECAPGSVLLCVSGSGSGGWSSASCEYGAGFSVAFQSQLVLPKGSQSAEAIAAEELGDDPGPPLCAIDPQTLAINSAVASCSAECYGTGDYFGCYCPCFSSFLVAQGITWASEITCS